VRRALLLVALVLPCCRPAVEAEAAYTAQLLACVADATTLKQSHACRAEIDRRWGIVDAGAGHE
jgi:hypothetical protein